MIKWVKWLRYPLGVAGFSFIIYLIIDNWLELSDQLSNSNFLAIGLSACFALAGNFLLARSFGRLLSRYGCETSVELGQRIFLLSQVTKYLPGKVWSYLLQISHLPSTSSITSIAQANIDIMIMSIWKSTIIGALLLTIYFEYIGLSIAVAVVGLLGSLVLASGYHWKFIARIFKLAITDRLVGSWSNIFIEFWASGAFALLAQYLLLSEGLHIEKNLIPLLISANFLSWVASVLLIIFPAGIGVREWVFIQIAQYTGLALNISAPVTIVIRLWGLALDLTGALISIFRHKFFK